MKTIYADREGCVPPQCPLRTDLNRCAAMESSEVNSCPRLDDNEDFWHLPEWCPLKKGPVTVELEQEKG